MTPDELDDAVADARSRVAFNIRRLRKARGWTQTELSRRAGLNRNSVQNMEYERRLTIESMCAVAVALGVEWPRLVAGPEANANRREAA